MTHLNGSRCLQVCFKNPCVCIPVCVWDRQRESRGSYVPFVARPGRADQRGVNSRPPGLLTAHWQLLHATHFSSLCLLCSCFFQLFFLSLFLLIQAMLCFHYFPVASLVYPHWPSAPLIDCFTFCLHFIPFLPSLLPPFFLLHPSSLILFPPPSLAPSLPTFLPSIPIASPHLLSFPTFPSC